MKNAKITYEDAGVNINAGNDLVNRIKPLVKSTSRVGADTEIGGFGGLFDMAKIGYSDPILVSATDGVGTKLKIATLVGRHDTIGIDLVAMCVNDLVVQGAEPLFFLDYFASGKLDVDQAADVVRGIADGCIQAGCALIGGETAEMPGMYANGDYDLAGFSVGAVERTHILPKNNIASGDIILGITSSGVHSNGFSLVRHIIESHKVSYNSILPSNKTLGDVLLEPTKIYVKQCLAIADKTKAFSHITGGGLTENIPRILPENLSAKIDCTLIRIPEIFNWLMETGNIEPLEMLRTFNCGVGMVVIASENETQHITDILEEIGEECSVIGRIIDNPKSESCVTYKNLDRFRWIN